MATLTNHEARLFFGPTVPGHAGPKWGPGEHVLPDGYWAKAKKHACILSWLKLGFISVSVDGKPRRKRKPKAAPEPELAALSDDDLSDLLSDDDLPEDLEASLTAERDSRA